MVSLDIFDRRILAALQHDGRMTSVALAEIVHLSPSQCARRVQRLEEAGVIRSYRAVLDPLALGLGIAGVVSLSLEKHALANIKELQRQIVTRPAIVECLSVTGDADYQLRIMARDLKEFSALLMGSIVPMPGVSTTRSSIILEEVKPYTALPIPEE
ncbi:MAG TPA: Lrp/AsnC family transcriptional regulator [Stellaceae bacterium]|nr:Lrp/AsnC family transcriptional regulator [Stellaceae bacterium]